MVIQHIRNKQWRTWAEFIESFRTYFLPRDFVTRLAGHVEKMRWIRQPGLAVNTAPSPTTEGNRRSARRSVDTTPAPTETAKQHLVEAVKQHTSHITDPREVSRKCGSRMSRPASVILPVMRQSGCQKRRVLPTRGKWPATSTAEASGGRTVLPLQTNWQVDRRGYLQSHNRHQGIGKLC